jgi:hypothetical protein
MKPKLELRESKAVRPMERGMTTQSGAPIVASQKACRLCGAGYGSLRLELGDLPPCNRYLESAERLPSHPLTMSACENCGLIQLFDAMPPDMVAPRVPWIRYNEPASHLNSLADRLLGEMGRSPKTALGIGPFEAPLQEKLKRRDIVVEAPQLRCPPTDGTFPYLEAWQAELSRGAFSRHQENGAKADLVTCRYLLEHCHAPIAALQALGRLSANEGLIAIEVPDSSKFLASGDYCFPWEEHICYFTEETLTALCHHAGFAIIEVLRYSGDLEDVLVAVARPAADRGPPLSDPNLSLFKFYRDQFASRQREIRRRISDLSGDGGGHVALFGAGHQAIMFANALAVVPSISYVVDDDPKKVGMIPPGFSERIRPSLQLLEDMRVRACLIAVSPRAESKVRSLLQPLSARGVRLHSIFAGVDDSIFSREC